MKQLTVFICLCFSAMVFLTACTKSEPQNVLNYQRKIDTLGVKQQQQESTYGIIDLSDGNKVNYDAHFGPSFDIQ